MVLFILQNNTLKADWQNVSLLTEEPVFLYWTFIIFVYLGWFCKTTQQIAVRKGLKWEHTAENRVSSSGNGLSKLRLPAWVFSELSGHSALCSFPHWLPLSGARAVISGLAGHEAGADHDLGSCCVMMLHTVWAQCCTPEFGSCSPQPRWGTGSAQSAWAQGCALPSSGCRDPALEPWSYTNGTLLKQRQVQKPEAGCT